MRTIIRLPRQYDVARLRADLDAAQRVGDEHENRGDYHDGGWSAIALYSVGGETTPEALRWAGWGAAYQPTPVLAHCPYFAEIIDGFASPKARVRLLQLAPGTRIHEHRDDGDGWAIGKVRLHIPIVTSDDVHFYVDGERVRMQPGELWYCDFTRPHRVDNRSEVGRIHLVLDLMVDDWLRALFPPEPLAERVRNAAQYARYRAGATRHALSARLRDL